MIKTLTLSWKTFLGALLCAACGLTLPIANANLLTDLQVYYQFDGNANDSSGNGLNLDTFGGVGFAPGLFGQALDLHGNPNQYAQRPVNDTILDFGSNDFTIQIWVNFNSITSAEQTILEKASNLGSPGWTISKITRSGHLEKPLL